MFPLLPLKGDDKTILAKDQKINQHFRQHPSEGGGGLTIATKE